MAAEDHKKPHNPPHTLYAAAMHEAVLSGDLAKMKEVAKEAEEHVHEWGNVPAALEALKLEISKAQKKPYGKG